MPVPGRQFLCGDVRARNAERDDLAGEQREGEAPRPQALEAAPRAVEERIDGGIVDRGANEQSIIVAVDVQVGGGGGGGGGERGHKFLGRGLAIRRRFVDFVEGLGLDVIGIGGDSLEDGHHDGDFLPRSRRREAQRKDRKEKEKRKKEKKMIRPSADSEGEDQETYMNSPGSFNNLPDMPITRSRSKACEYECPEYQLCTVVWGGRIHQARGGLHDSLVYPLRPCASGTS